jgi:hypothetical protein
MLVVFFVAGVFLQYKTYTDPEDEEKPHKDTLGLSRIGEQP